MKLINKFLYTNIFLSVAAVLLTVSAQIQLGMKPKWQPYLIIIFFATLFEYNRHRVTASLLNKDISNSWKDLSFRRKLKKSGIPVLIAIAVFLVAVISVKIKVLLTFTLLGILLFCIHCRAQEVEITFLNCVIYPI